VSDAATYLDQPQPHYGAEMSVLATSCDFLVINPIARDLRPRKTTGDLVPLETEGTLVIEEV
jgi:hypothetical protein